MSHLTNRCIFSLFDIAVSCFINIIYTRKHYLNSKRNFPFLTKETNHQSLFTFYWQTIQNARIATRPVPKAHRALTPTFPAAPVKTTADVPAALEDLVLEGLTILSVTEGKNPDLNGAVPDATALALPKYGAGVGYGAGEDTEVGSDDTYTGEGEEAASEDTEAADDDTEAADEEMGELDAGTGCTVTIDSTG